MADLHQRLLDAAAALADRTGTERHDVVGVLGSGLGSYPDTLEDTWGGGNRDIVAVPYADLPGFPVPTVSGHAGTAYSLTMGTNRVLLLAGRAHAYEGHAMDVVTFAVRTAVLAGCQKVLLTNAAGGCGDGQSPGDLVCITDHLNLAGISPLAGPNDDRLGPRFPDMSDVYTPALREAAMAAAARADVALGDGIYAWFRGPMFETPAEVQMARLLGASLVGMSTVPEAVAARHMGAEVLGISLVTNLAAGIAQHRLSGQEVMDTAARAAQRFHTLFDELLPTL